MIEVEVVLGKVKERWDMNLVWKKNVIRWTLVLGKCCIFRRLGLYFLWWLLCLILRKVAEDSQALLKRPTDKKKSVMWLNSRKLISFCSFYRVRFWFMCWWDVAKPKEEKKG